MLTPLQSMANVRKHADSAPSALVEAQVPAHTVFELWPAARIHSWPSLTSPLSQLALLDERFHELLSAETVKDELFARSSALSRRTLSRGSFRTASAAVPQPDFSPTPSLFSPEALFVTGEDSPALRRSRSEQQDLNSTRHSECDLLRFALHSSIEAKAYAVAATPPLDPSPLVTCCSAASSFSRTPSRSLSQAPAGVATPPPKSSLAQRRGLAVRRLHLVEAERARRQQQDIHVDTSSSGRSTVYGQVATAAHPANRYRAKQQSGFEVGFGAAISFDRHGTGTMGEYWEQHGMMLRLSRPVKASQVAAPTGSVSQPTTRPRSAVAVPRQIMPIRFFLIVLEWCKLLVLWPVWFVMALFSSKPPWMPLTPDADAKRSHLRVRSEPSPGGLRDDWCALEALSEPISP